VKADVEGLPKEQPRIKRQPMKPPKDQPAAEPKLKAEGRKSQTCCRESDAEVLS
jgi:hypothetical protein